MSGQDAAKRADAQRQLDAYKVGEFLGITQDRQVVDLMVAFADAAVTEARREEREAELKRWQRVRDHAFHTKNRWLEELAIEVLRPPASAPEGTGGEK